MEHLAIESHASMVDRKTCAVMIGGIDAKTFTSCDGPAFRRITWTVIMDFERLSGQPVTPRRPIRTGLWVDLGHIPQRALHD